jgi:hypothetical protein
MGSHMCTSSTLQRSCTSSKMIWMAQSRLSWGYWATWKCSVSVRISSLAQFQPVWLISRFSVSHNHFLFQYTFATFGTLTCAHPPHITEKLFLYDNEFTGSVNALCGMDLETFAANTCGQDEINCTCCTHCCVPETGYCDQIWACKGSLCITFHPYEHLRKCLGYIKHA